MAAGPHHGFLRNLKFTLGVVVPDKAHPETVFVLHLDIGQRHADKAMARFGVAVNQVMNDIYLAHGAAV